MFLGDVRRRESALRNTQKRSLALLAAGALTVLAVAVVPGTAYANDGTVTNAEVSAALDKADAKDDSLVAAAVASVTDSDSAAQTARVDVPVDPTKGVKFLTDNGQTVTVGLPNASQGGRGVKTVKGW